MPKTIELESKLEYPTCIICYDNLELHEIAQPPCKCNVEMCTSCLKRQFKIAEKDGVLECQCPNPYCKKVFDQNCFTTDKSKISKWLLNCMNTSHPYLHMLSKYQDFEIHEVVNIIYRSRNTAFKILKRTSAKWENERISISNIPNLKLSEVPQLYLKRTQSQEHINIHSIRIRSKSVPHHSSTLRHKLQTIIDNDLPIIIDNIDICNEQHESYSCRTLGTLPSVSKIDLGLFPSTSLVNPLNTHQKRRSLFANTDTNTYENKRTHNSMRKRFLRKLFKNNEKSNHQQTIRRGRGRVRDITYNNRLHLDSYSNRMMQMPNMSRIGSLPPKMKSKSNPSSNRSSISRKIIRRLSLLRSSLTDDDKPSATLSINSSFGGSLPLPVLTRQRSKSQEDNTTITINTVKAKRTWKNRMRIRRHSSKIPSSNLTTSGKQMILKSNKKRRLIAREFTHPPSSSLSPFPSNKKNTRIHWGMQHNTYGQQQQQQSLRLPFYNMSPETDTSGGDLSSDATVNDMPPPLRITSAYSSAPTSIPYHTSIMNNTTSSSNTAQLAIPNIMNSDEQYFSEEEYKHNSLLEYIANVNSSNKIEIRKLKPPTPMTPLSMTATPLSELSSDGYPYTHDAVLPNSPSMGSPTTDLSDIPNTTLSPIISGQIYLQSSDDNIDEKEKKSSNFLHVVDHTHAVISNKTLNNSDNSITHEIMSREENSDIYEHTPEQTSPYSPPQRLMAYLKTSDATESDLYSLNSRKTSNITATPKQSTDREYLDIDEKQMMTDKKVDIHTLTKIYSASFDLPQIMFAKETIRTQSQTVTESEIKTEIETTHTAHKNTNSKEDTLSENMFVDGNGTFVTVRLMTNSSHSAMERNYSHTDSQPIPSPFYHSVADNSNGTLLHNITEDINLTASIDTDRIDDEVCEAVDEEESNSVPPTPSSEDFNSLSSGAKRMLPSSAMYELTQLQINSESPMSIQNPYSRPSLHTDDIDFNDDDQHSTSHDIQQLTNCGCCVL